MKKHVLFAISWLIAIASMSQDQKAAEAFNAKVKRIDSLFAKPVEVLASQKYSSSPTGILSLAV